MPAEHPILARFAQLQDQWRFFVEHAPARLLVWRPHPDELPMLQDFLSGAADAPEVGLFPPGVVALTSAFESPDAHADALATSVHAQRDRTSALAHEVAARPSAFAQLFASLCAVHSRTAEPDRAPVVAWLAPAHVDDERAYRRWLHALAFAAPAGLRFVVVELLELVEPEGHAWLSDARIHVQDCALDMPEALRALAREADDGCDGGHYRLLLLKLADAIARRDGDSAERLARTATELAVKAGWTNLSVAPQMMLAAGCAGLGDPRGALRAYVKAEQLAIASETAEQTEGIAPQARCGPRLRLSARLGQAAQLLAQVAHHEAAAHYASCAQLAHELPDAGLALDAHRLAASCHAALGAWADAWQHGFAGLAIAEAMDAPQRASSTLAYLALQLQRLPEGRRHGASPEALDARIGALLGGDWRTHLPGIG